MVPRRSPIRQGATVVEFAVIAPLLFLLIFGLIVGGLGVFRYFQVASLAREAARYACVRGIDYERESGQPAATPASIYQNAVLANAAGLDTNRLTCAVSWDKSNAPKNVDLDMKVTINIVTVTVTYQWIPEVYFFPITLTSTSKMPMSH